jgi:hypothetical protein
MKKPEEVQDIRDALAITVADKSTPNRTTQDIGGYQVNPNTGNEIIRLAHHGQFSVLQFDDDLHELLDQEVIDEAVDTSMDAEIQRLTAEIAKENERTALAEHIIADFTL